MASEADQHLPAAPVPVPARCAGGECGCPDPLTTCLGPELVQRLMNLSGRALDQQELVDEFKAIKAACVKARHGGSSCKAGPLTRFHQACLGRCPRRSKALHFLTRTAGVETVKEDVALRHWACDVCLQSLAGGKPEELKGECEPLAPP